MKYFTFTILFAAGLLTNSCTIKPTADFSANKGEYELGETIYLTNMSGNAESYAWTGTGITGTVTTKDLQVVAESGGEYTFNLIAYSKKKKKSRATSRTVIVRVPVVFYAGSLPSGSIDVHVDGVLLGTITQTYSVAPECGAPGCVTTSLREGNNFVELVVNGTSIKINWKVLSQPCFKMKVG
jgi:hypothetical protein